jgi:transcriptional regulator with XRE-family HTH domain
MMPESAALEKYDFRPIGLAIKRERERRGISREALAELCDISAGYVKAIEIAGKNPGFQLFRRLVTMFSISVDEYFYPDRRPETDSQLRNIMGMLREIGPEDIYLVGSVMESAIKGLAARDGRNQSE